MRETWKQAGFRVLLSWLLTAGILLPVCGVINMLSGMVLPLLLSLGLLLLLAVPKLLPKAGRWVAVGLAAAVIAVLLGGAGAELMQMIRAVGLALRGQRDALPFFEGLLPTVLALLLTCLSWLLTERKVGGGPALLLCFGAGLLLWLTDNEALLWLIAPALAAGLTLLATTRQEGMRGFRLLPLMAALVIATLALIPHGAVIPSLKEKADRFRQQVFDRLFFTEPRDVFSLSAEGYYPQGQTRLGGTATPTDHPVMEVVTPKRVYLRGAMKDTYTGLNWTDTTGGRRYLWGDGRWAAEKESTFNEQLPHGLLGGNNPLLANQTVRVQLLAHGASTLFVPQRIRDLQVGGDLVPYFNIGSEVFATRNLAPGDTYTVSAPLIVAGDAGLKTLIHACPSDANAYAAVAAEYLDLPEHLQSIVYDLARSITESAATPYDKAFAIQNYLSRNYRYSLQVETPSPDIDFVTHFLFETRTGYCTYFATAMTVLCRMAGLPARYVEGYLARPGEDGIAHVTGLDAHAWTEVYLDGFGWLTFDATPQTADPGNNGGSEENDPPQQEPPEPSPSPEPDLDNEPEPSEEPQPEDDLSDSAAPPESPDEPPADPPQPPSTNGWWWLLLLILLIAAAAWVWLHTPEAEEKRAGDDAARYRVWTQALSDALTLLQLPKGAGESPQSYLRRVAEAPGIPRELGELAPVLAGMLYGRYAILPQDTEAMRRACLMLLRGMKPLQRVQFHGCRAVCPLKKRSFFGRILKKNQGKLIDILSRK